MDVEILQREVSSVICPDICFDNLNKSGEAFKVRRLYALNRLMSHLHIDQPIPFMSKAFQKVDIKVDVKGMGHYEMIESKLN